MFESVVSMIQNLTSLLAKYCVSSFDSIIRIMTFNGGSRIGLICVGWGGGGYEISVGFRENVIIKVQIGEVQGYFKT